MAVEASFRELDDRIKAVREAFSNLRVAVVEDGPRRGAPMLVDQLGDAATDLLGWLEEAAEVGAEGLRRAGRPRDLEAAQAALLACHERLQQVGQRFATELLNCERVTEIHDLGRERGRSWQLWSESIEKSLDHCQTGLLGAGGAVLECWKEISELAGAGAVSVRATSIGQQFTLAPVEEGRERASPERESPPKVRRAG
ncbi:MAG: hypothetical protein ACJ75H_18370 [Thermoanaerobaculia bacterium]